MGELLDWELSQHLDMPELLSEAQTSKESRLAIESLYTLFGTLAVRKRGAGVTTLSGIDLERTFLRAYFDLGEQDVSGALAALHDSDSVAGGDFVNSFHQFMKSAGVAKGRADRRCVINVFRSTHATNELVFELRPCQSSRIVRLLR